MKFDRISVKEVTKPRHPAWPVIVCLSKRRIVRIFCRLQKTMHRNKRYWYALLRVGESLDCLGEIKTYFSILVAYSAYWKIENQQDIRVKKAFENHDRLSHHVLVRLGLNNPTEKLKCEIFVILFSIKLKMRLWTWTAPKYSKWQQKTTWST